MLVRLTCLLLCLSQFTFASDQETWVSIFNGKDLSGWSAKFTGESYGVNYRNTFRVRDGKLIVTYEDYETFDDNFGHLFYQQKLSHYRLRLEYRFVGEQLQGGPWWAFKNSGIKFHSIHPAELPKNQKLLVAIEAQLVGGDGVHERSTGNVCTAGTHVVMNGDLIKDHCIGSSAPTFNGEQWVTAEIEVLGNGRITHWINGAKVLEYEKPQLDPDDPFAAELLAKGVPLQLSEGYIALQAESHPVEFRNIQLMILKE